MLQCQKCGADNMVNAIFCRQCQTKLDLDEITPDAFDDPEADKKKRAEAMNRLITTIVAVCLLGIIGLLFVPGKLPVSAANLDQRAQQIAEMKFAAMQRVGRPNRNKLNFSNEEATHVAMKRFGLPQTSGGNRPVEAVSVQFLANGKAKIVMKSALFGKLPMFTTISGTPTVSSPGQFNFKISSAKIGMLPFPGPLGKKAAGQIKTLLDARPEFSTAASNLTSTTITANQGSFVLKLK